MESQQVTIDEALVSVGEFGRGQLRQFCLVSLVWIPGQCRPGPCVLIILVFAFGAKSCRLPHVAAVHGTSGVPKPRAALMLTVFPARQPPPRRWSRSSWRKTPSRSAGGGAWIQKTRSARRRSTPRCRTCAGCRAKPGSGRGGEEISYEHICSMRVPAATSWPGHTYMKLMTGLRSCFHSADSKGT